MWKRELGYVDGNTVETLASKYRSRALRVHPDKGGSTEAFQKLQAAWELAKRSLADAPHPAARPAAAARHRPPPTSMARANDNGGACPDHSHLSKYAGRPSPPRPANLPGCRGKTMRGNDGRMWQSRSDSRGIFAWKPL